MVVRNSSRRTNADNLIVREATVDDVPSLHELIAMSARELCRDDYTQEQIETAIGTAWGVDTQLIRDRTYFCVTAQGDIVACGGWSWRNKLFGSDEHAAREPAPLDPRRDAARVRAFFAHPSWTRIGLGRMLLERCELEARAAGFQAAELVATLPGQRLYRAFGYVGEQRVHYSLPGGATIEFVPMTKRL